MGWVMYSVSQWRLRFSFAFSAPKTEATANRYINHVVKRPGDAISVTIRLLIIFCSIIAH
jgi:hypothetical protein